MSLILSPAFSSTQKPVDSTILPQEAYVLSLASISSFYAAASSAPTNAIYIFDKSELRRVVQTLPGHDVAITALRSVGVNNAEILLSSGQDGVVRTWDVRASKVAIEMSSSTNKSGLLCCDISLDGLLVAAGTELKGDDASILYWDPRNPAAPLRTHSYVHSDDITGVLFSPAVASSKILLSVSSDGLISITNAEEDDEDEAGLNVGNWGCSISKLGWLAGDGVGKLRKGKEPKVWACSDMETFSTWSEELDILQDLDRGSFTYPNEASTWVTDYIIDVHASRSGALHLFAGSNEGDISILRPPTSSAETDQWTWHRSFTSKHEDVVRSILWDESNGILLSGGEDSKIHAWSCPAESSPDDMDVDVPRKRSQEEDETASSSMKRTRKD